MSNVIKSYTVRYEEDEKKMIDTHLKKESDLLARRSPRMLVTQKDGDFIEGLQAVVIDPVLSDEELAKRSVKIIENSKKESHKLLEKAKQEAEQIKKDVYAEAKKLGYEEGMRQGLKEVQKELSKIEETKRIQQEEYNAMLAEMEPQMVDLLAALLEKITGILVEDKREVIGYLVEKALKKLDKEEEIKIRVGKEDYAYLLSRKEDLSLAAGRDIRITIEEDADLLRQQCLIETELKIIDCSLDVQLANLIMDLKLLGNV